MKIFDVDYFNELAVQAWGNPRKRHNDKINETHEDICQRLFNAIDLGSYIQLC